MLKRFRLVLARAMGPQMGPQEEFGLRAPSTYGWRALLLVMIVVGYASVLLFSAQSDPWHNILPTAAVGLMVAGACLVVGGIVGFLFGIPRSLQHPGNKDAGGETPQPGSKGTGLEAAAYGANTNLEQISDWLTKILVGVGLTQLAKLHEGLSAAATYVGEALVNASGVPAERLRSAEGLAYGLILYFTVCGFLYSYLWSRLYLQRALTEAGLLVAQVEEAVIGGKKELATAFKEAVEGGEKKLEAVVEASRIAGERDQAVLMGLTAMGKDALFTDRSRALAALHAVRGKLGEAARRDRQLNFYYARLQRLQGQLDFAIQTVTTFIVAKEEVKESDQDLADAYYNRACYLVQEMSAAGDDATRDKLKNDACVDLATSIKMYPPNKQNAAHDEDFDPIRNDPRFQELVRT